MAQRLLFILVLLLAVRAGEAQGRFGLSTGYAFDLNNDGRFRQIPVSAEFLTKGRGGSWLFRVDLGIPLTHTMNRQAYTLAEPLPQEIFVGQDRKSQYQAFFAGFRTYLLGSRIYPRPYLDVAPFGVGYMKTRLRYRPYDQDNYEILDFEEHTVDFWNGWSSAGLGVEYESMQLRIQVMSAWGRPARMHQYSYKLNAPCQLSFGYLITTRRSKK